MLGSRNIKLEQSSIELNNDKQPLWLIDQENPDATLEPMPNDVKWVPGRAIIRDLLGRVIREEPIILVQKKRYIIGEAISLEELQERNKNLPFLVEYIPEKSGSMVTPNRMLRKAVQEQDRFTIHQLFGNPEFKLNINTRHPMTGRTILHEVAMNKESSTCKIFFKTLITDYKADKNITDNEGFTPIDLLENPHPFPPQLFAPKVWRYATYFVNEINIRLSSNKTPKRLKIVKNTRELLQYVDQNPQLSQIGFIVHRPNCNNSFLPYHASPILFDRKMNVFVQLDSMGLCYIISDRTGAKLIYSPIERQVSERGCLEDSINLSYFILTQFPGFFKFCQNNSVEDTQILEPKTEKMSLELSQVSDEKKRKQLVSLLNKAMVQKQMDVLIMHDLKPLSNLHRLSEWPVELVMFLENFNALYPLRTKDKLGDPENAAILKTLLQKGTKRNPLFDEVILKKHLIIQPEKHDRKYDIGGTNMAERSKSWVKALNGKHHSIKRLFWNKLDLAHIKEKQKIVDNISDFVGTFNVPKFYVK